MQLLELRILCENVLNLLSFRNAATLHTDPSALLLRRGANCF